jgi:hypothetical protein
LPGVPIRSAKLDGWDFGEAELLGGLVSSVARYDAALAVHQQRVREAESLDAAGDQIDLSRRVRARVARVRSQRREGAHHDFICEVHRGRLFYSVK